MIICLTLGTCIVVWVTGIQGQFLDQLGISKFGALTIEPLAVISSFLLGVKITRIHRVITLLFLVILFGVSLITVTSMYAKRSYVVLEQQSINKNLSSKSSKSEEVIANVVEKLGNRDEVSSKNISKIIGQLQKQQDKTDKRTESTTLELHSIIEVISSILHVTDKVAILIFSIFISLAAVFAPSFLFFSAGMMIQKTGIFVAVSNQIKRMSSLSLKQKVILMTRENVTTDVEEMAKFLGTSEQVINGQLSRISKKIKLKGLKEKPKEEEELIVIKKKKKRRKPKEEIIDPFKEFI